MREVGIPYGYRGSDDSLIQHRERLFRYAEKAGQFATGGKGLFLFGRLGRGKSRAMARVAELAVAFSWDGGDGDDGDTRLRARFVRAGKLIALLAESKPDEETRDAVRDFERCHLLCVDDIGSTYEHEWPVSRFADLVEARHSEHDPTCFTSNLFPREISQRRMWERIAERLNEDCYRFEFTGPNLRTPPDPEELLR